MKKMIVAVILICICLNLCACEKSEEAQIVDDLILSIGDVTLATKATINNVREQYEMLSEKEKQQVENYHILENAIETLSILEEEKARINENYLKIYNWCVENGEKKIDTDINSYGEVLGYHYTFKSSVGNIIISFEDLNNGKITSSTYLSVYHSSSPGDFDSDNGNLYELNSYLLIYPSKLNLTYMWEYGALNVLTSNKFKLARGFIDVDDISQISSSGSNYIIADYTEADNFKKLSGYTDVRAEINKDLLVAMGLLEEFLTEKVGFEMADIGFTSYS